VDVIVPNVMRFGEKNKGNARVSRAVLCVPRNTCFGETPQLQARRPRSTGKDYRLLKIVTQVLPHGHPPRPISLPGSATTALRL
jgi:hypothetical protein